MDGIKPGKYPAMTDSADDSKNLRVSVFTVTKLLSLSALPSLIQSITANLAFTILIFFVSLNKESNLVGAVGMGSTIYFTGITAFLQALNIGLSTLGSQAFGANNPQLLGYYFKKTIVVQLMVLIPLILMVARFSKLFKLIGFEPELAENIENVILAMMPSAVPFLYFDAAKNYLVAQKIFIPQGYVQIATSILDVPVQYILIVGFDLKITGVGLCRFIMESCRALCLYYYIHRSGKCEAAIVPWDRNCFRGLFTLFKFQLAAGSLQILDIIGTQIILLQAGSFSPNEVTANVVLTRITKFCAIWSLSLGISLTSFVGNSMGEQNEGKAKLFIRVGIVLDFFLIGCIWYLLGSYRISLAQIFSNEEGVIEHAAGLLYFYLYISPFENLQNVLGAILQSVGKEKQSSKLYMLTYYPIAIPLSMILAHLFKLRLYGLYGAMLAARIMNVIGSVYFLCRVDISEQIQLVVSRVESNQKYVPVGSPTKTRDTSFLIDTSTEEHSV